MAFEIGGDAAIARTASQMLAWAVQVPNRLITVSVNGRIITLSGQVTWQFERDAAARAVMYINGVRSIVNEISWIRGAERASVGNGASTDEHAA
jgi:osmotically-inducible protein OsmY